MSFFADLLAGSSAGFGKVMVDSAEADDRREAALQLQREKQQAALDLQKMRAEDRAENQRRDQEFKTMMGYGASGRSGSGGSGGGTNVMDLVMSAARSKDPEEQRIALSQLEVLGGPEAAKMVAEKMFGRPMQQAVPADFVGLPGQSDVGPDAKRYEKAAYIAEKASVEFQRAFALTANKGEIKNFAEGEGQLISNDLRAAGVQQALKQGKPLDQASAYGSKVGDPATYYKNQTNADRVSVSEKNAQARLDAAEARRLADVAKAEAKTAADLDKAILDYEKLKKDASPKDRAVYDAVITDLKARRSDAAPASASSKPTGSFAPVAGSTTKPPATGTSVRDMIKAKGY